MSEKNEIKRDGARAQKNSGRGQYLKGDATWGFFLVDYKESSKSFSLSKQVWAKLCSDTWRVSRDRSPALKVIIGEGNEKVRLAVIEWSILEELVRVYEKHNEAREASAGETSGY